MLPRPRVSQTTAYRVPRIGDWLASLKGIDRRMKTFQLLVAAHTRQILRHLNNPDLADEEQDMMELGGEAAASLAAHEDRVLDIAEAEIVGDGHYVFPAPEGDGQVDWYIMLKSDLSESADTGLFDLAARFPANFDTESFLSASYQTFFGRQIDPVGLESYSKQLDAGEISRRDVFKILLKSKEGRKRKNFFLLIPARSPWLAAAGLVQDGPGVFFRFLVKK